MALPQITPRRAAPYLVRGAYSAHILARMWRLSKLPPSKAPLHRFLLKNTDIVLVVTAGPVIWGLVERQSQRTSQRGMSAETAEQFFITHIAHGLRQVFTSLLLGLGLIKRKAISDRSSDIPRLVDRLQNVVAKGIQAINVLDPPDAVTRNGDARVREA